ncbi:hypothetical protein PQR62_18265 [Herbaspirillum lusitanum]|uniref:Uncharacterized protein n=1 Tax=Herbaspirillum lusitanum TaxID=213312 RepID=A0ABW9ABL0_9BURK
MRIYSLYFAAAVTLLASSCAEAASREVFRSVNNEWFFQLLNTVGGIVH